jgi:GNAT superfamily N-acetyltransferase
MAKFECLVAELDGQPVGCALICRGFEAHTGRRLWLGDLYVRKAARLSGAGRSLMAALARRALDLDCEALYRGGLYSPFFPFFHLEKREQLATVARTALGTSAISSYT